MFCRQFATFLSHEIILCNIHLRNIYRLHSLFCKILVWSRFNNHRYNNIICWLEFILFRAINNWSIHLCKCCFLFTLLIIYSFYWSERIKSFIYIELDCWVVYKPCVEDKNLFCLLLFLDNKLNAPYITEQCWRCSRNRNCYLNVIFLALSLKFLSIIWICCIKLDYSFDIILFVILILKFYYQIIIFAYFVIIFIA